MTILSLTVVLLSSLFTTLIPTVISPSSSLLQIHFFHPSCSFDIFILTEDLPSSPSTSPSSSSPQLHHPHPQCSFTILTTKSPSQLNYPLLHCSFTILAVASPYPSSLQLHYNITVHILTPASPSSSLQLYYSHYIFTIHVLAVASPSSSLKLHNRHPHDRFTTTIHHSLILFTAAFVYSSLQHYKSPSHCSFTPSSLSSPSPQLHHLQHSFTIIILTSFPILFLTTTSPFSSLLELQPQHPQYCFIILNPA